MPSDIGSPSGHSTDDTRRDSWQEGFRRLLAQHVGIEEFFRFGDSVLETLTISREKANLLLEMAGICTRQFNDVEKSLRCLVRAADVLEKERATEEEAFSLYWQALSLSPQNRDAFLGLARICSQRKYWKKLPQEYQDHLERLLSEQGHWDELLRVYQSQVEIPEDTRQAALTYLKMGEILEMNLKRSDAALNAYKMAQSLFPEDVRAFEAVWQLLSRMHRWEDLRHHLESQIEFLSEPQRKIALYLELAVIAARQMGRTDLARHYYQEILTLDPQFYPAYEPLTKIYEESGDHDAMYRLLHRQRTLVHEPRVLAGTYEALGRVCLYRLGLIDEAEKHFEACLRFSANQRDALLGLDLIYSKRKAHDKLMAILKTRALTTQDPHEKARTFGRLGRLFWDIKKDAEQAAFCFQKLIELTDRKELGFRLLDRLYRDTENIEGRVQIYRERAQQAPTPEARREVFNELAQLLEGEMKHSPAAERLFQEISHSDAGSHPAVGSLKRMYREQERWEDLHKLCWEELERATDEVIKVENLLVLAELDEYQFENYERAATFYQQAQSLNPRNLAALKGLERIYLKGKDYPRLLEIYRQGIELAQDLKEEAYLYFRMGEVSEGLSRNVAKDPGREREHLLEAVRHLEAALLRDPQMVAAVKALIVSYERLGDWDSQVRVRKLYAASLADSVERAEQVFRVAETLEQKLSREQEALLLYEEAARLDPGHLGVLKRLSVFYYQTENWVRALSVHEALEETFRQGREQNVADLGLFYFRLGQIYDHLGRRADALAAFSQAKTLSPGFPPVRKALADLYFREQKWPLLREELMTMVDTVEPGERVDILFKLATAEAAMQDLKEAEHHFLEILTVDPLHEAANATLVNLYQGQERFDDLAALYRQRMAALNSPDLTLQEGLRLVALQAGVLQDVTGAHATFRRLRAENPGNEQVFQAYRDFLRTQKLHDELLGVLNERIIGVTDEKERLALRLEVAEILEGQTQGREEARSVYQEILREQPEYPEALKGLARVYLKDKAWRELIEMYEIQRRGCRGDEEAAVFSFKIGEIQVSQLKREDDAILSYKDAFTKDPGMMPAIRALRRLYERRQEFEKIPPLIVREIELAQGRGEEARLHYELGKLFEEKLNRSDKALKHYEDSLRIAPGFSPPARRLAVHAYQSADWPQAEKYYDLLATDLAKTAKKEIVPRVAAGFFYKFGRIAEHLEKDQKAIDCYRRSLEFQEGFFPSLSALASLCERRGWWEEAKLCMEQMLRIGADPAMGDPSEWQYRLAVVEGKLGNREVAIARHKEVLKLRPDFLPSLEALAQSYEEDGKWRVAIGMYDKIAEVAERTKDPKALLGSWMRKARLWREELKESAKAIEALARALPLADDPASKTQVLEALMTILVEAKDWNQLLRLLPDHVAKMSDADPRKLDYRLSVAQANLEGAGDLEHAGREIRAVLRHDPTHLRALTLEGQWLGQIKEYAALANNLEQRLEILEPQERKARGILLHELGDLYAQHLRDQGKALKLYREAVELNSDDLVVHRKLASLYGGNEDFYQQAVKEHHYLLEKDPFHFESYHNLGNIYEVRGEMDRARFVYDILVLMGQAVEREVQSLRRLVPRKGVGLTAWPERLWQGRLRDQREIGLLQEIWEPVAGSLEPLFETAEDQERLQSIDWKDPAFANHLLVQILTVLGVTDVELQIEAKRQIDVQIRPGSPSILKMSQAVLDWPQESARRFAFARSLAHIKLHHALALWIPEDQLKRLFLLIAKCVREDLELEGYDEKSLKQDLKRIRKALPKKLRSLMSEPVDRFIKSLAGSLQAGELSPEMDFERWRKAMSFTANRVGLLVGQDLRTALEMLRLLDPQSERYDLTNPQDFMSFLQGNEQALELVKFSVSLLYFELREQLGLTQTGLIL